MRIWRMTRGEGPIVAAAIHDGHDVRYEVRKALAISPADRLREEDPYSGPWTEIAPTRVVGRRSRFEVDLNRPREQAVYLKPEDAWGLTVWDKPPAPRLIERSLAEYDSFYQAMHELLTELQQRHGHFFVYDLHAYNHRRNGPAAPPADSDANPEVNIGTGTLDRAYWAPVVDRFIDDLRAFDFLGRRLDVRENVKFVGRGFPKFVHEKFPRSGCAIAIEFKKFFMDEWTGELFPKQQRAIVEALRSTVPGVIETLAAMHRETAEVGT